MSDATMDEMEPAPDTPAQAPLASARSQAIWVLPPILVVLLAALPLWLTATWVPWVCVPGVALVAGATVWALLQRLKTAQLGATQGPGTEDGDGDGAGDDLARLVYDILPAWQHHVGLVKQQTEDAVIQLTTSFGLVLEQFDQAGIGTARQGDTSGTLSLLTLCDRELQPVVGSLTLLLEGKDDRHATLRITIAEGRNRQVRRMFDSIGHPVDYLRRIAIGPLKDPKLKPGHWRDLTPGEVAALKRSAKPVGLPKPRERAKTAAARDAAPKKGRARTAGSNLSAKPKPPTRPGRSERASERRPRRS